MKKLLYSTLSIALIASAVMVGCKDGGGPEPEVKKPQIEFQTNTGTFSGYTFANDRFPASTGPSPTKVKIGVKLTADEGLKSTKMTITKDGGTPVLLGTDSVFSGSPKSATRDYNYTFPLGEKGTYVFTAHVTDGKATTNSASITITIYGPLGEIGNGLFYSLKATTPGHFSAYDLLNNEAITAASGAGNEINRDIVDMSTSATLSRTWKSQNGTQFIISGADGKLNGKTYTQFKSEQDIIDAWNAIGGANVQISGIDDNKLIIAKSVQGGTPKYYMIAINTVTDDPGAEDDTYDFHYQN